MDRRIPLQRSAPLAPGGPLRRTAPQRGPVPPPRQVPLPRRTSEPPEKRHAKEIIRARSGGTCEICGMKRACDPSHRRAAAHGGPWSGSNLLDACRPCHEGAENLPLDADAGGWRIVHRDTPPAAARVWLPATATRLAGWWLLDDGGGVWETDGPVPPLAEWERIVRWCRR